MTMQPVGVLGGTFDPVHHGHLRTALELLQACELAEVRFIPCGQPPHRAAPVASAQLRWRMLKAALRNVKGLVADDRELRRAGPSYMVDTLASLREEVAPRPVALLLGADAFTGLPAWHRWTEICQLAHLVVVNRPGADLPAGGPAGALLRQRRAASPVRLCEQPAGLVAICTVTQLQISASAIRTAVALGDDPRFLVPDAVRDLILESRCYAAAPGGEEPTGA